MPAVILTEIGEDQENLLIFSEEVTSQQIKTFFEGKLAFSDCFDVPEEERQFYLFDPFWLTPAQEAKIKAAA